MIGSEIGYLLPLRDEFSFAVQHSDFSSFALIASGNTIWYCVLDEMILLLDLFFFFFYSFPPHPLAFFHPLLCLPTRQKKNKKHKNTQKKQKAAPWRKTFPSAILWKSQKQPHIIFIWRKGNKEMNRSNKFPLNPNYWFISLVNIQSVSHVTHNHIILIPECQHYI